VEEDYTTDQAARILRVSPQRVRRLIAEGKLEAQRVDDRWLIDARSVHSRLGERPPRQPERPQEATERAMELVEEVRALERSLGRLEGRLELTERAESSVREERDRLLSDLEEERNERRRLQAELDEARLAASRPWWRRIFG